MNSNQRKGCHKGGSFLVLTFKARGDMLSEVNWIDKSRKAGYERVQ